MTRYALTTCTAGRDETTTGDALKVASMIIDAVTDELEQFEQQSLGAPFHE